MFKMCSENFSGLPIYHGFYLLSVLNRNWSPHSQKTLPEVQAGKLPCTHTFSAMLRTSATLFYLILIVIIRCRHYWFHVSYDRHTDSLDNLLMVLSLINERCVLSIDQSTCKILYRHSLLFKTQLPKKPCLGFCKFLPSAEKLEHHLARALSYYQQINVRVKTVKIICYLNVQEGHPLQPDSAFQWCWETNRLARLAS